MDYLALAQAIASRFSGTTPPAGMRAVTGSTATPPNAISNTPYIIVWPDQGSLTFQPSQQLEGEASFNLEFYYAKNEGDVVRESTALLSWLGVLIDRLFSGGPLNFGLGPTVLKIIPVDWEILQLSYAPLSGTAVGATFDGIRIGLKAFTREYVTAT